MTSAIRRNLLGAVAAAVGGLPSARPAQATTGAQTARFAALERPALRVSQPEHAIFQAAARAGQRTVVVGEHGLVLCSDDLGQSWRQASVPVSTALTAVAFADAKLGWAVGHGGVILVTRDAGQTWQRQADGRQLAAWALADAQARTGLPGAQELLKQVQTLMADGPDKPLLELRVVAPQHVVVLGAYGLAFESRDGGQSWQSLMARLGNPKALHLYSLAVEGQTWLVAGEQGLLLRSQDAGAHFERLPSPYAGSWFSLAVPAPGVWLLGGLRGNAMVSHDQGSSWQPLTGLPAASVIQACSLGQGRVLLANQAGQLLVVDLNQSLVARVLPIPPLPPLTHVLPMPGAKLLALSLAGLHLLSVPTS